ncbi:ER membrane complex subunit 10 isoform X2 [Labeo rohita]|uniref:ER membrane protein complex subunit 10 n=1 Tax=Labeo rohita TaxID=84645 RepID=A0A498NMG2_LABRO|nr:ER membrane complex subunit 10 isoform X2 [Labeo rohita]
MAMIRVLSLILSVLSTVTLLWTQSGECNNGRRSGDAVDTDFSGFSVPLEHSFEVDDVPRFRLRGALQFRGGRENGVYLSQNQLSEKDRNTLKDVAAVDGLYRIRVPRVSLQMDRQTERQSEGYLTTFVRAWMYIVPLVLFLMMSGAQDQSGGGAGGGAANGGGR